MWCAVPSGPCARPVASTGVCLQLPGSLKDGAVRAQPENFHGVVHFGESVLGSCANSPGLYGRGFDFNSFSAVPAEQVVVVCGHRTATVHGLAVAVAQHVNEALISEGLQDPVRSSE